MQSDNHSINYIGAEDENIYSGIQELIQEYEWDKQAQNQNEQERIAKEKQEEADKKANLEQIEIDQEQERERQEKENANQEKKNAESNHRQSRDDIIKSCQSLSDSAFKLRRAKEQRESTEVNCTLENETHFEEVGTWTMVSYFTILLLLIIVPILNYFLIHPSVTYIVSRTFGNIK